MSARVLSTETAKTTIVQMQQVINGPLTDQITQLQNLGNTLSQPDVWDGQLAIKFRSDWPEMHAKLVAVKQAIEELRAQSQQINQNIMAAGGNS